MTEPGEYMEQIWEEIERAYPEHTLPGYGREPKADWWNPVGPVQPCQSCGTRIFPLEDNYGARRWCQVGNMKRTDPDLQNVKLAFHTDQRCNEMRLLNTATFSLDDLAVQA